MKWWQWWKGKKWGKKKSTGNQPSEKKQPVDSPQPSHRDLVTSKKWYWWSLNLFVGFFLAFFFWLVYRRLNLPQIVNNVLFYSFWAGVCFYLTTVVNFVLYYFFWHGSQQLVEFTVNRFWDKAGIIEIRGGTRSGKTLLIMLLIKIMRGKKWSSVPTAIHGPGWLKLPELQAICQGKFPGGNVGKNNVLLIDESWNFFSSKHIRAAGLEKKTVQQMCYFLSETGKHDLKIFLVSKKGAKPANSYRMLLDNKTATINCLGTKHWCKWRGKDYFYLKVEFEGSRLDIPYTQDIFDSFDPQWNLDKEHAENKTITIAQEMKADRLTEYIGRDESRRERLQKDVKLLKFLKERYPYLVTNEYWEELKKRGWQSKADIDAESAAVIAQLEKEQTETEEKQLQEETEKEIQEEVTAINEEQEELLTKTIPSKIKKPKRSQVITKPKKKTKKGSPLARFLAEKAQK